jgi:peptidoglycan lytic transglycosylase
VSMRREAAWAATLAAAATLQWGCASNAPKSAPREGSAPIGPSGASERSDRGNPPFYDVLGRRYYVLSSSDGYRARGVASWYGRDFQGLSTSSGETYNMLALTAAHKTLPIPTWVEVTNLENGRRVVVKVNDRGPFVDDRLIDLSYAAARELDMIRDGTARVEIRALASALEPAPTLTTARLGPPPGASSPAFAPAPAAPSAPAHGGIALISSADAAELPTSAGGAPPLFAQVGAFSDGANAARLVDRLRSSGFAAAFVVSEPDGRRTLHRVRVGPLQDEREFDQVRARLRALGFGESQLVTAR